MESLSDCETIGDANVKTASTSSDRAVIGKVEALKINSWVEQIREATRGFISLTKSDLVNFLIREHRDDLNPKEISQIRSLNYDPVKHINWISQELKTALLKNDLEMVAVLQGELKQVELSPQNPNNDLNDGLKAAIGLKRRERKRAREADGGRQSLAATSADFGGNDLSE